MVRRRVLEKLAEAQFKPLESSNIRDIVHLHMVKSANSKDKNGDGARARRAGAAILGATAAGALLVGALSAKKRHQAIKEMAKQIGDPEAAKALFPGLGQTLLQGGYSGGSIGAVSGLGAIGAHHLLDRYENRRKKTASFDFTEALEKVAHYTGLDADVLADGIASYQEELIKLAEIDNLVDQLSEEEAEKILEDASKENPEVAAAIEEIEEEEENEELAKIASIVSSLSDEEALELLGE